MRVGQTLLVRLLNAGYTIQEYRIGKPGQPLDATVIATDGHAFGIPGGRDQYASPFVIPAGNLFRLTTTRRIDLLFRPTVPGNYPVVIKHLDWTKSGSPTRQRQPLVWGVTRTIFKVVP